MFWNRKLLLISTLIFLIPLLALGAPDYLVRISINSTENVTFANHSESLTEGNWIELSGGTSIELPQITFIYNGVNYTEHIHSGKTIVINASSLNNYTDFSVRYPLTRHAMYTNVSGNKTVNATFYGNRSFANMSIDWHLILTGPTEFKNALNDSLYGNTTPFRNLLDNAIVRRLNQSLNATTGDNQTSFGELNAGDYVVIVKLNETGSNLTLLSMTTFQVLEYESTLTAASSATVGDDVSVSIQMVNATNGTYRFGTIIIHENAYNAELRLKCNGSTSGTNLTADGQLILDQMKILGVGINSVNASRVKSIVEGVIGSNNGSVNYADPTTNKNWSTSINTDGMNAGRYIMMAAVWDVSGGKRLVAFAQQNITLSSPAAPPPSEGGGGGGGGGGAPAGEPYENVDVREVAYILTIAPNQHICKQFARNHSIIEICFTYASVADEVSITIEKLLNRSLLVNVSPPGIVYEYDNIWVNLPNPLLVSNASIKIRVDKNWINASKIDSGTIAMYRYREDAWNKLGTAKLSEDDNFTVYSVTTPGFSPFAITGEKVKATPIPTVTKTPVATPTFIPTPTATPIMTPTPEPGVKEEEMFPNLFISGIMGGIVGFGIILLLVTRIMKI